MANWHGIELPTEAPSIGTALRPEFMGGTSALIVEVQPAYSSSDTPEHQPDTWYAIVQEYKGKRALGAPIIYPREAVIARYL